MSSHREAPAISKDPAADNTDTYAFRSGPDRVTIVTNYLPAQNPAGGPNFYEFDDTIRYQINIDNDGDGFPDVVYEFRFRTQITNPNTFLYNTGPISLDASGVGGVYSDTLNRKQFYNVRRLAQAKGKRSNAIVGRDLPVPPCNIGPRSTPDYESLAAAAVVSSGGSKFFAGQRADPFFVDLGSIFDLGALRPFQNLHLISTAAADGVDTLATANVHTIAIEVPISDLTRGGVTPTDPMDPLAVIGVWGSADRRKGLVRERGFVKESGPPVQVSRLGMPLTNEVLIPMALKDRWNALSPSHDAEFAEYHLRPELAGLLPVLYPDVFSNLAAYDKPRADVAAIFLTGIPAGIVPGFQNYTGPTQADELRLNVAIPPSATENPIGLVAGDPAGFPNGRRLGDDVVAIELKAVAGATIPLVDPGYTPDGAASLLEDGTRGNPGRTFLGEFPYVGTPYSGYEVGA